MYSREELEGISNEALLKAAEGERVIPPPIFKEARRRGIASWMGDVKGYRDHKENEEGRSSRKGGSRKRRGRSGESSDRRRGTRPEEKRRDEETCEAHGDSITAVTPQEVCRACGIEGDWKAMMEVTLLLSSAFERSEGVALRTGHAYSPHERATSNGACHAVLAGEYQNGRLQRKRGDALCKPASEFWGLENFDIEKDRPEKAITCKTCLERANRYAGGIGERVRDCLEGQEALLANAIRERRKEQSDG